LPYDKIVPPPMLLTSDPEAIPNYKPIPKALRQKMEQKFGLYNISEATIIEEDGAEEDLSK
jgi:hypothetical protein